MDNVRFILVVALAMLGLMLWEAWQEDYGPKPLPVSETTATGTADATPVPDLPAPAPDLPLRSDIPLEQPDVAGDEPGGYITVETDLLSVVISTTGGTVERSALKAYPIDPELPEVPVHLSRPRHTARSGRDEDHLRR